MFQLSEQLLFFGLDGFDVVAIKAKQTGKKRVILSLPTKQIDVWMRRRFQPFDSLLKVRKAPHGRGSRLRHQWPAIIFRFAGSVMGRLSSFRKTMYDAGPLKLGIVLEDRSRAGNPPGDRLVLVWPIAVESADELGM